MSTISNYILNLKDCYEADNRSASVLNIYDSKTESRIFLDHEELLTHEKDGIELEINYAQASQAYKKSFMYRKEKELLYASTLLIGVLDNENKEKQKICAPLFMYPAEIEITGKNAFLRLDRPNMRVNFGLLSLLYDNNDFAIKVYDEIMSELSAANNQLSRDLIIEIIAFIKSNNISIDRSHFTLFPVLAGDKTVKSHLKKITEGKGNKFILVNSGLVMVTKKPRISRGIIDETERIAKSDNYSLPLNVIFNDAVNSSKKTVANGSLYTPVILSRAQEKVIHSCSKNPLSLVIGPPGTGKSYTIAALALNTSAGGNLYLSCPK